MTKKKKFRQINYLVILLVKTSFSRNFCQDILRVNFRNFHTALWHSVEISYKLLSLKFLWRFYLTKSVTIVTLQCKFNSRISLKWDTQSQCGNNGSLLSNFFGRHLVSSTVWKNKDSLPRKLFRQIKLENKVKVDWRNFCDKIVAVKFPQCDV